MIDILEVVYRGARQGKGLVVSPKDFSTKYKYWLKCIILLINLIKLIF